MHTVTKISWTRAKVVSLKLMPWQLDLVWRLCIWHGLNHIYSAECANNALFGNSDAFRLLVPFRESLLLLVLVVVLSVL